MSSSALSKVSSSQSISSPAPLERLKTKKQVTLLTDSSAMSMDAETFGIPNNLDLKLSQNFASSLTAHSDALIDHLNQQIRELKDETGRLYKLVSERELELRRLKQKREEEQMALNSVTGMAGDAATAKIVELSKRVRELTAELESERTKLKLANKQCVELKFQLNNTKSNNATNGAHTVSGQDQTNEADSKGLQEKIKQLELKLAEYRNQCQSLRQEIKLAQKVLAQEVGEGVSFQELVSGSSGWRGRAQQIIQLQKKVNDLRSQADRRGDDDADKVKDDEMMTRKVTARPPANDKHREHIRKVERDNKEHVEKLMAEMKALEGDYENMKTKAEASKARNSVLSNELKTVKQQLQILTKKGEHDDQLIQALLKKQGQLNELVDAGTRRLAEATERYEHLAQQMTVRQQQETTVVDQLKTIIAEKQAQISQLEDGAPHDLVGSSRVRSSVTEDSDRRVPIANVRLESFHLTDKNDRRESARSQVRDATSAKRPPSTAKNEVSGVDGQSEIHEVRCLYQVAQVERDRLMELSQTLQNRLTEVTEAMVTQQNELSQQRRTNSLLQKQIDRLNIDQTKAGDKVKQAKSAQADNRGDNMRASRDFRQADELEKSLAVKSDENEALRAALQSTLQAKEEDMQLFQNIIDEAKSAFLLGLRHIRQLHVSGNAS